MGRVNVSSRLSAFETNSPEPYLSSMTTVITDEGHLSFTRHVFNFVFLYQREEVNAARSGDHL